MDTKNEAVVVRILDKDYMVSCPKGERDVLLSSAHSVDKKMREIRSSGKVIGVERIAVMVALNLAHELFTATTQVETIDKTIDNNVLVRLSNLQDRIDTTLKACNS